MYLFEFWTRLIKKMSTFAIGKDVIEQKKA